MRLTLMPYEYDVRPSVCLSVCLSVMLVKCDHIVQDAAKCLIPHERAITLVTARAYATAILRVVILSVRPSVCMSACLSHAWILTNLNGALHIF